MAKTQITAEPAVPQLIVTSEFAAPRDLLFRAYTDPELLVQWLGPRGLALTVDHVDTRHGGTWRYIGSDADGGKYSFRGVFHGTPSPDGIVQTSESDSIYQSAQDRDRALRFDMAEDINESIERLEELLTRLVPERTATPIQPAWR